MKPIGKIIIVIIVIGVIIGFVLLIPEQVPDISEPITPTQAREICNSESCVSEEVTIEGENHNLGTIVDDNHLVAIKFSKEISLGEIIELKERLQLTDPYAIIQVRVKGKLNYVDSSESTICTDTCVAYVEIIIEPEDMELVKTIECEGGSDNCFDNSRYELKASEAYEALLASEIGTKNGREATGYYDYDFGNNFWRFQISDPDSPGGCSDYCHVYKNKIVFKRTCAYGMGSSNEITEEESY